MNPSATTRQIYDYQKVLNASLQYFSNDELAATTWINKYCLKDKSGNFMELTPDDMHQRMATEFGRIEAKYDAKEQISESLSTYGQTRKPLTTDKIYQLFKDFKYVIPQGSVMFGLGNKEVIASLSNCIVVPSVLDSYGGIFIQISNWHNCLKDAAVLVLICLNSDLKMLRYLTPPALQQERFRL